MARESCLVSGLCGAWQVPSATTLNRSHSVSSEPWFLLFTKCWTIFAICETWFYTTRSLRQWWAKWRLSTLDLYPWGEGHGVQGQICDILRPQLAMNRFLTLWPHRFPHFGCIHLWGGGVGDSDIRSMWSIRPICKCRCPPLAHAPLSLACWRSTYFSCAVFSTGVWISSFTVKNRP